MLIKISQVRDPEQLYALIKFNPQYIGFDFRRDSPHYLGEVDEAMYSSVPIKVRRCGVFENDDPLWMLYIAGRFSLSTIQLEGDEPLLSCELLAGEGVELIKVIKQPSQIDKYAGVCNKFLIRDADILSRYHGRTPLFVEPEIYNNQEIYALDIAACEVEKWINFFKK